MNEYPQPNTYYPPGQVYQPPPMPPPPPPPKRRTHPLLIAALLAFVTLLCIGSAYALHGDGASSSESVSTQSTGSQQWTTVQTFKGDGNLKTGVFFAPDDWKITWQCYPTQLGDTSNMIVSVYNADATPMDIAAINTICQSGNTNGATEEHQGGNVYLDIRSEGSWTVQVQFLE